MSTNGKDPQRQKIAGDCFRRGNDAFNAKNYKFAVQMFGTCVKMDPGNLRFRQQLRIAEAKSYGDNKTGAGGLSKAKIKMAKSAAAKAMKKEDWESADQSLEEGLVYNPWEVELNHMLGKVALQQDNPQVAEFAMQSAVAIDPDNEKILEDYAEVLQERHKYDEAGAVWTKLMKLRPNDGEARAMVSRMAVLKTQHHGGYDDAANTQDVKVAEANFNKRVNQSQKDEQDEEGKLKRAIRQSPKEVPNYLKLADLLRGEKRYQESYDTLKAGVEIEPENVGLIRQQQEVELELRREKIRGLMDGADTEEGKAKLMSAKKHLLKREIEIFTEWEKRTPKDMDVKYELANRLMSVKQYKAAIPLLQKATQSPKHKTRAYVGLGKAFIQDKKLGLARAQFERAVPDLNQENDPETYVESHYLLGRVCEELGDLEKAEEYYGEVLVAEYDYKDALNRLESLQSAGA